MIDFNEYFNDSYERISANSEVFFDEFYLNFIKKSDELDKMFAGVSLERQKMMLKKGIFYLISFYSTKQASDYLVKLAALHQNDLKIRDSLYEIWVDSMLETVEKLDPKYSREVEMGWRITMSPGIEFMKYYSEE
ncbi:MAG: globin [Planctomycetaceae bacterium]|nr:globin [Planctomycetaceae bacterium]